jgi:hypothetical protein
MKIGRDGGEGVERCCKSVATNSRRQWLAVVEGEEQRDGGFFSGERLSWIAPSLFTSSASRGVHVQELRGLLPSAPS